MIGSSTKHFRFVADSSSYEFTTCLEYTWSRAILSVSCSEHAIVAARASVMVYDDGNKKWVPSGSSQGISKVQIYHHSVNNTFRVVGRKLNDHEVRTVCQSEFPIYSVDRSVRGIVFNSFVAFPLFLKCFLPRVNALKASLAFLNLECLLTTSLSSSQQFQTRKDCLWGRLSSTIR